VSGASVWQDLARERSEWEKVRGIFLGGAKIPVVSHHKSKVQTRLAKVNRHSGEYIITASPFSQKRLHFGLDPTNSLCCQKLALVL